MKIKTITFLCSSVVPLLRDHSHCIHVNGAMLQGAFFTEQNNMNVDLQSGRTKVWLISSREIQHIYISLHELLYNFILK